MPDPLFILRVLAASDTLHATLERNSPEEAAILETQQRIKTRHRELRAGGMKPLVSLEMARLEWLRNYLEQTKEKP